MRPPKLRVLMSYGYGNFAKLDFTSNNVADKLFTRSDIYPGPPVPQLDMKTAIEFWQTSQMAQADGGPPTTAETHNLRSELIALLDETACYVQSKHKNNMAWLLASGFEAVSTNRARVQLERPKSLTVTVGMSGQLVLKVKPVKNAKMFEVEIALMTGQVIGEWTSAGLHSDSRAITITGLEPGAVYAFRLRAIGGLTGYSDWSHLVTGRSL